MKARILLYFMHWNIEISFQFMVPTNSGKLAQGLFPKINVNVLLFVAYQCYIYVL